MQTVIAAELIEAGKDIIIENGLVRVAIPHVHRTDRISGHSADVIKKGESAWWDRTRKVLRQKRNT